MSVELRGSTFLQTDGDTSVIPIPVDPVDSVGWFAVVSFLSGTTSLLSAPTDWTQLALIPVRNGAGGESGLLLMNVYVYYRFLDGTETETTWLWDGVPSVVSAMDVFSGVDSVPFYKSFTDRSGSSVTLDLVLAPFVAEKSLLYYVFGSTAGAGVITPHASTTQLHQGSDSGNATRMLVATERAPEEPNGPTTLGARSATQSIAGFSGALVIALVPALDEAAEVEIDARDRYKSILLRQGMSRSYRRDRDSSIAKVLAALGEADDAIGGLFGRKNFLVANGSRFSIPVRVATSSVTVLADDNGSVVVPHEVVVGDALFVHIAKHSTTGSSVPVAPAGWTLTVAGTVVSGGGALKLYVFRREADGTEADTSLLFTWVEADADAYIHFVAYRGGSYLQAHGPYTDSADAVFPTLTSFQQENTVMLVAFAANHHGNFQAPYMTELYDPAESSDLSLGVYEETQTGVSTQYRARAAALGDLAYTHAGIGAAILISPLLLES